MRRKRLVPRCAALVVAVSALAAAYWFSGPPDLVWWTSPESDNGGRHVRVLAPRGLVASSAASAIGVDHRMVLYEFQPVDTRPRYLRWLLPFDYDQHTGLAILVTQYRDSRARMRRPLRDVTMPQTAPTLASRSVISGDQNLSATAFCFRTNLRAFDGKRKQICNSLRIE
jgi:hypothetical protein